MALSLNQAPLGQIQGNRLSSLFVEIGGGSGDPTLPNGGGGGGGGGFGDPFGGGGSIFGVPVTGGGGVGDPFGGGITYGTPIVSTGGGGGGGGGITYGTPVITTGGTPTTTTTTTTPVGFSPGSWLNSLLGSLGCSIADVLLRIAFLILGFIAIVGAIYLYKGSNPVLQIPAKLTRTAVKHGRMAIEAGAEL